MAIKYVVEVELVGRGNGFTDITMDLHEQSGMDGGFGLRGTTPEDRVATTGVLTLHLINSVHNSGGKLGYYTVGHVDARAGFLVGIGIRVSLDIAGTVVVMWTGEITHIEPTPGINLQRLTRIVAVDYMDKVARTPLAGLGVFTNLVGFSDQLDQWSLLRATVSADAITDPNGNLVGDKLVEDSTSSASHFAFLGAVTPNPDGTVTATVYLKEGERNWVDLNIINSAGDGAHAYFDLTFEAENIGGSGPIGSGVFLSSKIEDAGFGWYRCFVTAQGAGGGETAWTMRLFLADSDGGSTYSGDGSSGVFVCRNMFEQAAFASTYIETTTAAAVSRNKGLLVGRNVREQDAFTQAADLMTVQPRARSVGRGFDTYDFAFDMSRDEGDRVTTEFQRIAMSSLATIYTQADGTLVYEPRTKRATPSEAVVILLESDLRNSNPVSVADRTIEVVNKVTAVIAPRREEPSEIVLYELSTPEAIPIGGPFQVKGLYTDPSQRAIRSGGTDQVEAVANTDYVFNTLADGTGDDITGQVSVTTTFTSNAVLFGIINASGDVAWATKLQARGIGIHSAEAVTLQSEDDARILQFGEAALEIAMPYQSDLVVAQEVADWLLFILSDERKEIAKVPIFLDPGDPDRALLIANRTISDRFSITEQMTGLLNDNFFINAVDFRMDSEGNAWIMWTPAPADDSAFWYLEVVGFSELGQTTTLGFGYVVGHVDVDHSDSHVDTAHTDGAHNDAHTDTHTDGAHGDTSHGDTHSDDAHSDSHNDTAHGDVSHVDDLHADSHSDGAHGDAAHVDTVHTDSHSDDAHGDTHNDNAHADVSHVDVAHVDTAHGDTHSDYHEDVPAHEDGEEEEIDHEDYHEDSHTDDAHVDTHTDVAHTDDNHSDLHTDDGHGDSHTDGAHGDSHTDNAHSDTHNDDAHADSHTDNAHADQHTDDAHNDSHGDGGHTDEAHGDVSHVDTHTDVSHLDTAYIDEHGDTAHGDAN